MLKQKRIENPDKANNKNSVHVALKLIVLIYFFSGICSLIDEVVWVRLLKLTLGNTVYASSIVVSVFMGGLALGSLIMSRYADQIKKKVTYICYTGDMCNHSSTFPALVFKTYGWCLPAVLRTL
jgi:MFS family permease